MTEPANYQAAIDALAKACVGLADVVSCQNFPYRIAQVSANNGGGFTVERAEPARDELTLVLRDTKDATENPVSREELYELAMLYFESELAAMRGSPASSREAPTPRDRLVRLATKIRRRKLLGRMDSQEKIYLTSVDIDIFKELEAVVDAMERR